VGLISSCNWAGEEVKEVCLGSGGRIRIFVLMIALCMAPLSSPFLTLTHLILLHPCTVQASYRQSMLVVYICMTAWCLLSPEGKFLVERKQVF